MARGGLRVGAGRKPKGARVLELHGGRVRSAGAKTSEQAASGPLPVVNMPEGLSEAEKAIWNDLAPHALEARTLTPGTLAAFRDLCEAIVLKRMMLAEILADGLTTTKVTLQMDEKGGGLQAVEKKAHTLLSQHRGMMQRVEAGLQRFRLAPMGKEIPQPVVEVDPFAEFESAQ